MKSTVIALATGLALFAGAQAASAASVLATYYKATAGGDFENLCCSTSIELAPTLGPNGLPVWVSGEPIVEKNAFNEIQWWTPDGSHITTEGSVLLGLPFSDTSVFTPFGTGSGNGGSAGFQTVRLRGFFNTTDPSTALTFNVTSDDDVFLFIDGNYVDSDLDGIHGPTNDVFGTSVGAGLHTFNLFYADRHTVDAVLSFDVLGATLRSTGGVPEPASWALMILGFGGVGAMMRRRRTAFARV
jgi:hypothetical protein